MSFRSLCSLALLFISLAQALLAASNWADPLAKAPPGVYPAKAAAAVLLDERTFEIRPDGTQRLSVRYAVRILKASASHAATAACAVYDKETKFKGGGAWLFRDGKRRRLADTPDWVERPLLEAGTAKSEAVRHVRSFANHAEPGDVFAAEWSVQSTPLASDALHTWSADGPIEREVVEYRLPPGWTLEVSGGNTDGLVTEANGAGGIWRWSRRTPGMLAEEPDAPGRDLVASWLRLRITPPSPIAGKWLRFDSWSKCGSWIDSLAGPQLDTNPALEAKAASLAAASDGTQAGQVYALAEYVRRLPYVAIQAGLGRGLGVQPRRATEVLAQQFGDCKDKANLFRALCAARGVKTYLVATIAGTDLRFDPTWISPGHFDHAIAAVVLDAPVTDVATQQTEGFGRLVYFDATSPHTYFGDLPEYLHGKPGLILDGERSTLVYFPEPPERERYVLGQDVRLKLGADGSTEGRLTVTCSGASAQAARAYAQTMTEERLKRSHASKLVQSIKAVEVTSAVATDLPATHSHRVETTFRSPNYAQRMHGGLMILKLDVFGEIAIPRYPATTRERALVREAFTVTETLEIELPPQLAVEDLPKDARLESEFGTCITRWTVDGSVIRARREFFWRELDLPPARYNEFKTFLEKAARAYSPAVLVKTRSGA
ncbi:MAG: hypothetical protein SFV32_09355 [Opitutaceae bacterium]|nr:hypothetical protein [Opitutaceae bacterium]